MTPSDQEVIAIDPPHVATTTTDVTVVMTEMSVAISNTTTCS
jgi:hypothetical protein